MTNGTIEIKANDKIDLLYFIALHLLIKDKNTKFSELESQVDKQRGLSLIVSQVNDLIQIQKKGKLVSTVLAIEVKNEPIENIYEVVFSHDFGLAINAIRDNLIQYKCFSKFLTKPKNTKKENKRKQKNVNSIYFRNL